MFVYFVFILVPMVLNECRLFFELNLFIYRVDIFMYLLNTCLVGHSLMTVHKKRQILVELHQQIVDCELLEESFFDQCQALLKEKFKIWVSFYTFCAILCMLIPLSVAFLTEAEKGTLPTLFFPFLLPWASNTVTMYAWTMFIQMTMGIIPLCIIGALVFLSLYFEVLLLAMCQYIKNKISVWDQNNKKRRRISLCIGSDDAITTYHLGNPAQMEQLQHIIHIHQFLRK